METQLLFKNYKVDEALMNFLVQAMVVDDEIAFCINILEGFFKYASHLHEDLYVEQENTFVASRQNSTKLRHSLRVSRSVSSSSRRFRNLGMLKTGDWSIIVYLIINSAQSLNEHSRFQNIRCDEIKVLRINQSSQRDKSFFPLDSNYFPKIIAMDQTNYAAGFFPFQYFQQQWPVYSQPVYSQPYLPYYHNPWLSMQQPPNPTYFSTSQNLPNIYPRQEVVMCKESLSQKQPLLCLPSGDGTKRVIQGVEGQEEQQPKPKVNDSSPGANLYESLQALLQGGEERDRILANLKEQKNTYLLKIYENLLKKQKCQIKSREELIKFCLRKAFRFIFHKIQKENASKKLNLKAAQRIFAKTYLRDEHTQFLLPFRKNSKNKTMNMSFLNEIFSSQRFAEAYREFLTHLDSIIEKDLQKKLVSLVEKLEIHIQNNKKGNFDTKRVPWSKKNIEKVRAVANELLSYPSKPKEE